jgi:hypothetical protein
VQSLLTEVTRHKITDDLLAATINNPDEYYSNNEFRFRWLRGLPKEFWQETPSSPTNLWKTCSRFHEVLVVPPLRTPLDRGTGGNGCIGALTSQLRVLPPNSVNISTLQISEAPEIRSAINLNVDDWVDCLKQGERGSYVRSWCRITSTVTHRERTSDDFLVVTFSDGGTIAVTPTHFLVGRNGSLIPADQVQAGGELTSAKGTGIVGSIQRISGEELQEIPMTILIDPVDAYLVVNEVAMSVYQNRRGLDTEEGRMAVNMAINKLISLCSANTTSLCSELYRMPMLARQQLASNLLSVLGDCGSDAGCLGRNMSTILPPTVAAAVASASASLSVDPTCVSNSVTTIRNNSNTTLMVLGCFMSDVVKEAQTVVKRDRRASSSRCPPGCVVGVVLGSLAVGFVCVLLIAAGARHWKATRLSAESHQTDSHPAHNSNDPCAESP